MAITITDQPLPETLAGQRLMVVATSTNVAEPGFRYKASVYQGSPPVTQLGVFYIAPNSDAVLIIDMSQFLNMQSTEIFSGDAVHEFHTAEFLEELQALMAGCISVAVDIEEAWEVLGVLTDDPDAEGTVTAAAIVWNGTFQASDGYKPSIDRFVLDGQTKRFLSDRQWNTHTWQYAETFGFPIATNKVFIPVTEDDWGVISIFKDITGDLSTQVRVTLYDSSGTPNSFVFDITSYTTNNLMHLPLYPANINASTVVGFDKPSDNPGWRCYTVQALDVSDNPVSVLYVFYNATLWGNTDCRYERVRMAWKGFDGSWEYQNFTKKNEESIEIERKRYQQVLGTYGTSFTQNGMQRGLTEVGNITKRFLTINSDWISEGEFQLLRGMMVSRQVHWVQDDGTFIPMLVEDNTYTEQRTRDGKLKNLTVKLSYANNLWT